MLLSGYVSDPEHIIISISLLIKSMPEYGYTKEQIIEMLEVFKKEMFDD